MNNKIKFLSYKAIFCLFPTHAGGRNSYIENEYSPNAVFGFDPENLSSIWDENYYKYADSDTQLIRNAGVKLKPSKMKIYPGGVTLTELIITEDAAKYITESLLNKGSSFLIREGSRVVGLGELL